MWFAGFDSAHGIGDRVEAADALAQQQSGLGVVTGGAERDVEGSCVHDGEEGDQPVIVRSGEPEVGQDWVLHVSVGNSGRPSVPSGVEVIQVVDGLGVGESYKDFRGPTMGFRSSLRVV
jgi:hypothetical protein